MLSYVYIGFFLQNLCEVGDRVLSSLPMLIHHSQLEMVWLGPEHRVTSCLGSPASAFYSNLVPIPIAPHLFPFIFPLTFPNQILHVLGHVS